MSPNRLSPDTDTQRKTSPPWIPILFVGAIWLMGWFSCSLDVRSPFPDISADDICSVVPGIGIKWTDIILAVICGIISAGWAESRIGENAGRLGRHIRIRRKDENTSGTINARLWFMAGVGCYFIFASVCSITLFTAITTLHALLGFS